MRTLNGLIADHPVLASALTGVSGAFAVALAVPARSPFALLLSIPFLFVVGVAFYLLAHPLTRHWSTGERALAAFMAYVVVGAILIVLLPGLRGDGNQTLVGFFVLSHLWVGGVLTLGLLLTARRFRPSWTPRMRSGLSLLAWPLILPTMYVFSDYQAYWFAIPFVLGWPAVIPAVEPLTPAALLSLLVWLGIVALFVAYLSPWSPGERLVAAAFVYLLAGSLLLSTGLVSGILPDIGPNDPLGHGLTLALLNAGGLGLLLLLRRRSPHRPSWERVALPLVPVISVVSVLSFTGGLSTASLAVALAWPAGLAGLL